MSSGRAHVWIWKAALVALVSVVVLVGSLCIIQSIGKARAGAPGDRSISQPKVVTAGVDAAIEAWDCGNPDDAVKKLTAAAESGILVGSKLPVFMLSEADVAEMSEMRRNQFVADLIKRMESLNPLGQFCLSAGDALLGDGDVDGARNHYNAVARLGAELQSPGRVTGLHSLGAYFTKAAIQRLSGLELRLHPESEE